MHRPDQADIVSCLILSLRLQMLLVVLHEVRAPRASVESDTVFFVFDDRLYGRDAGSSRGWERLYMRHRLRAVPVAWFYGQAK